jgi:hypothetical protein
MLVAGQVSDQQSGLDRAFFIRRTFRKLNGTAVWRRVT